MIFTSSDWNPLIWRAQMATDTAWKDLAVIRKGLNPCGIFWPDYVTNTQAEPSWCHPAKGASKISEEQTVERLPNTTIYCVYQRGQAEHWFMTLLATFSPKAPLIIHHVSFHAAPGSVLNPTVSSVFVMAIINKDRACVLIAWDLFQRNSNQRRAL